MEKPVCALTLTPVTHLLGTFLSLHLTALGRSHPFCIPMLFLSPNAIRCSPVSLVFQPRTINSFLFLPCLSHFPCFVLCGSMNLKRPCHSLTPVSPAGPAFAAI